MSLRFGTIQSCLNLMVVLSCQRDRARKRDASRAWACLPHTWTDNVNDRPHTEAASLFLVARVPGRCSGTRPAREAAVPRTG